LQALSMIDAINAIPNVKNLSRNIFDLSDQEKCVELRPADRSSTTRYTD